MTNTIFYSWQSDRPSNLCRGIIGKALENAIDALNLEISSADRPEDESIELDHDTKGLPGSPDIAQSILRKIDGATAFIADITPIGLTDVLADKPAKHLSNPNVLIELGYAKKSLSLDRVILVWNTYFTGCRPEDLPFDMRGKRGPITYSLSPDASSEERKKVKTALSSKLKAALSSVLAIDQIVIESDRWSPSAEEDFSIWPHNNGVMPVNEPDHGSGQKRVFGLPRSYVRIMPSSWRGSDELDRHDLLLGMVGGFSWGATNGGILTYPGSILFEDTEKVHAITKRFSLTGELWATRTDISGKYQDDNCIRGDEIVKQWADYLYYAAHHIVDGGGKFPLSVMLGVVGLEGLHWSSRSDGQTSPNRALQDELKIEFVLESLDPENIWEQLKKAWIEYRRIFSIPEPSMPQMQDLKSRFHR